MDNGAMEAEPPVTASPKRKRRWYQFSLRSLMVVVTLLAVPLGYVGWQAKIVRERNAKPALPVASHIASMEILIQLNQDKEFKEHETIDVRPAHFVKVLSELASARREPSPVPGWVVFGAIRYADNSGTNGSLPLFITERREIAFRTDGDHYYRGDDIRRVVDLFRSAGKP